MATQLYVAARTDRGRVRDKNEDAFVAADLTLGQYSAIPRWSGRLDVGDSGALLAVADGLGGAQQGELASALVVSSLAQALAAQAAANRQSSERITGAVENAHQAVWLEACRRGIHMGATLTAAYVRSYDGSAAAYVAEVGDSRAYLLREGRITQLTKDQSYVQMLVDAGTVEPSQAQSLPFRNVILQAMGHQPTVKVALGRLDLRQRDCLLLCSDGLTSEVPDEEVRSTILSSPDLVSAAERLVDLANARGGRDNTTVLVVGVGGDLPAPQSREPVEQTYRILESFMP
jgi:serine/threonine protein phosphatase PrpC